MTDADTPARRYCVLVCGGRDYSHRSRVDDVLDFPSLGVHPTLIIVGSEAGADGLACDWASRNDIPCTVYWADWEAHGKAAGPLRNQRMLDEGKPDFVVAFPGGRGTADMVRRAKAAGVPVLEVQ